MSIIKNKNVYLNLQEECRELGITIADVCRSSGVDRSHIQYWKEGNPSTIDNLVKLQMDINQRREEHILKRNADIQRIKSESNEV